MNIEAFLLCDAATEAGGKLNVLGAFDSIRVRAFPVVHPHCAAVFRIRMNCIENGSHRFTLHFVDGDGRHVIPPLEDKFEILLGRADRTTARNVIMNINGLRIEHAGEYAVNLAIDGRQVSSIPLYAQAAQDK